MDKPAPFSQGHSSSLGQFARTAHAQTACAHAPMQKRGLRFLWSNLWVDGVEEDEPPGGAILAHTMGETAHISFTDSFWGVGCLMSS